ncbi:MAG: hypothetical protein WCT27_02825 [Patescibacteria group bacterium]|jgi:hypothetical protein
MAIQPIPVNPEKEPGGVEDIFAEPSTEKTPLPERREVHIEVTPERPAETRREQAPEISPEGEQARRQYAPPPQPVVTEPIVEVKSEEESRVEAILSDHLEEIFMQMNPAEQAAFQKKGEETATAIAKLLQDAKVKVKSILDLIRDWLRMIPGVNKFFLEQEAKIKADRIIALHEQKHKDI